MNHRTDPPHERPQPDFAPPHHNDLKATRRFVEGALAAAPNRHRSALRTPALVTAGATGGPEARTVVLREAAPLEQMLVMHTDVRSEKWAQLGLEPRAMLLAWERRGQFQLRIRGTVSRHRRDALADAAFARLSERAQRLYRLAKAPGGELAAPGDAEGLAADDWFGLLRFRYEEIEYLSLAPAGHRRARFRYGHGTTTESAWLMP